MASDDSKKNLKFLASLLLLYSMNIGIIITVIPLYSERLGADDMTVGFTVSVYAAAYTATSLLWGKASDLFGRKLTLCIGMLCFSVTVFLFAFAHDPGQLLILRLVGGLTDSSFWTVPTAIVADMYTSREMGTALGKVGTFQTIGFIAGPLLGGILVKAFNYRILFYICSVFILLITLLMLFGIREKPRVFNRKNESATKAQLKFGEIMRGNFAIAYTNTALSAICFGVIVSQFIITASKILGSGTELFVGLLLSGYYVAQAFIQAPIGKLSDVIGRRRVTVLGFVLCALGFFLLSFSSYLSFLLIAILIIGGGMGALYVAVPAALMDKAPASQRGLVSGFRNIGWGSGYFVGSTLGGLVAGYFVGAPFMLCVVTSFLGSAITLYGTRTENLHVHA
ncbi:MAG: MFS transporter [Candidatus Bathyarchaeota archaeon]|nr:MAG: MFS transporter [Candidatus Bathyarchaeota archaeon]